MDNNYTQWVKNNFDIVFDALNRISGRNDDLHFKIHDLHDQVEKCHREYAELRKQSLTTIESVNEYLSVYQLCHYIPSHPVASTIRTWCCKGDIPHHKMSGKLVFLKNEIDEWLKSKL